MVGRMNHFGNKSQKEFRLNSGSLKPEFSGFAGFKLSELNMRKQGTAEERAKNVLARVGRAEERSQNVLV